MAINLAKAAFDLMVYDLQQAPLDELRGLGAKVAKSLNDIGAHSEIIEIVVRDDAQLEAVILGPGGLRDSVRPGTIIAVHSTVMPATIRKTADGVKDKGATLIDAQISGGRDGAFNAKLCYMVGGEASALERCRPAFVTSAANIFHMGPLGAGATAKIAHNLIVYVTRLGVSEGMRLAEMGGLDLRAFQAMVGKGSAQSRVMEKWLDRVALRGGDEADPTRLPLIIYKDLHHALELGHEMGANLPAAALAQQLIPSFV
jgi:3-hydroxyisobutyrate dehydrogenase-like beta-hydroxyacid dehydrogenase